MKKRILIAVAVAVLFISCVSGGCVSKNPPAAESSRESTQNVRESSEDSAASASSQEETGSDASNPAQSASSEKPTVPVPPQTEPKNPLPAQKIGVHGTAENINGTTLIVSIFAGDSGTHWDWSRRADSEKREKMLKNLNTATEWLSAQCRSYGASAKFICDWRAHPELYYETVFNSEMVRADGGEYLRQRGYIEKNINRSELLERFGADNIVFIYFFNTADSNTVKPWSVSTQSGKICRVELINAFVHWGGIDIPPATLAHEIMHCFGAKDLYYASDAIPADYVKHCGQTTPNDIMYSINSQDTISGFVSEVDAYYMGLVKNCREVSQWGLGRSEF